VTAYGREALLRAKEAAEDMGCTVLHLYVDGLWVKHPEWQRPDQFQALLDEIARRTRLSISLDGIYRWVAFLPSRVDNRVPVANRYFGVFQDGSLKVRGIEARRRDTPPWIAGVQMALLECLAQAPSAHDLPAALPKAVRMLQRELSRLAAGRVPPVELLVSHRLSKVVEAYQVASAAARAVKQLQAAGKALQPGQSVRFLYMLGKPGVHAWDLPDLPDPRSIDLRRYRELMMRAASAVLQPLGIEENTLRDWVLYNIQQPAIGGQQSATNYQLAAINGQLADFRGQTDSRG